VAAAQYQYYDDEENLSTQEEDAVLDDILDEAEATVRKRAWNSHFSGGLGKRAWNSNFHGGLGKRRWNSNFSGGIGKRAWNSNFSGGLGKRAWNNNFSGPALLGGNAVQRLHLRKFQEDSGKELGIATFLEGWENGLGTVASPAGLENRGNQCLTISSEKTFQTIGRPVTRTRNTIQVSKQRNFFEKFCRSNVRSD